MPASTPESLPETLRAIARGKQQKTAEETARTARQREELQSWALARLSDGTVAQDTLPASDMAAGAVPTPGVESFDMNFVNWVLPGRAMAKQVVAGASAELRERVSTAWADLHKIRQVPYEKTTSLPDERSACYHAGMCICERPDLARFVKGLTSSLRRMCSKGTTLRSHLDSNILVLKLFNGSRDTYVYITFANLTTWRAAVLPLMLAEGDGQVRARALGRVRLRVRTSEEFFGLATWWRLLSDCDFSLPWSLSFFMVHSSEHSVDEFIISEFDVEAVYPVATDAFWDPARPVGGDRHRPAGVPEWGGRPRRGHSAGPHDRRAALEDHDDDQQIASESEAESEVRGSQHLGGMDDFGWTESSQDEALRAEQGPFVSVRGLLGTCVQFVASIWPFCQGVVPRTCESLP